MAKLTKPTTKTKTVAVKTVTVIAPAPLLRELRALIADARQHVARSVDSALVQLYWQVGHRIRTHILKEKRADYGKQIVHAVSEQLAAEFGSGFGRTNLFNMIRFAEVFPDREIVHALCGQLGWSHFRQIIYLKEPLQREFYAEMCRVETWSTRALAAKIQGMLFERTLISRKPAELAKQELKKMREEDRMTPDLTFRDPYLLDFLGLKDTFCEGDMETAILRELQRFLVELGTDFAFIARQKRIVIADKDHYIDPRFSHRRLRRLVVIDLKLGAFQPGDKGQMELYLRWLAKHEQQPHEEAPIGLNPLRGKSRGIRRASGAGEDRHPRDFYTVDTGTGLVFKVRQTDNESSTLSAGEIGGALGTWNSGAAYTTHTSVTSIDSTTEIVTVRDNSPATGRRFIRLNIGN